MQLKKLESAITREERNKLNENFGIIETLLNALKNQMNNIVASAGKDNSENVAARTNTTINKSYTSVGDRLDEEYAAVQAKFTTKADQSFVDAQFASIVSGSPKGTFTDYAALVDRYPSGAEGTVLVLADGHWYYWNDVTEKWEDGGIYQASEVADKSVTPQKTTFLKQTKNLATEYLTKTVAGTATALFTMPDGDTSIANGRTMIVPIEHGATYTISVYDKNESDILAVASDIKIPNTNDYDANNRYRFKTTIFSNGLAKQHTFTNTANDTYLFVCTSYIGLEPRVQIEKSDVATPYTEPIILSQDIVPIIEKQSLPTTRNLVTGDKIVGALGATTTQIFAQNGNSDVYVVPIEIGKTYTVSVQNPTESDVLILGTHSKVPSYYNADGRSYLNNLVLTAVDGNKTRTITFTNNDDRFLLVQAYNGRDKNVKLQVEESDVVTDYVPPYEFMLPEKTTLADELKKSIYEQDYKSHYVFDGAANVFAGDVTITTNNDGLFTRHNTTSKKLVFNASTATDTPRVDFELAQPIDLYDKNFGVWFYVPKTSLQTDSGQYGKWKALAFMFYTASGKIFQVYPTQPKRGWEGWNLIQGNAFNGNFSDGSLSFEDLKQVTKIRLFVVMENPQEPFEIYLDSLVTWKRLNKIVARLEFDDAYKTVATNAFPEMRKRGIRGCAHVITDRLTDNLKDMFATPEQLHHMHDVGWDICSHTTAHDFVGQLTTEQLDTTLRDSQATLRKFGFRNGIDVFVAPYGDNTAEAVRLAKQYYKVYRNTGYQIADDVQTPNPYGLQCLGAGSLGLAGCKALVDKAVERGGGFLPFIWHGEIGEDWGGVRWETSEFAELLDYCIANGVEFVTYSDQYK